MQEKTVEEEALLSGEQASKNLQTGREQELKYCF